MKGEDRPRSRGNAPVEHFQIRTRGRCRRERAPRRAATRNATHPKGFSALNCASPECATPKTKPAACGHAAGCLFRDVMKGNSVFRMGEDRRRSRENAPVEHFQVRTRGRCRRQRAPRRAATRNANHPNRFSTLNCARPECATPKTKPAACGHAAGYLFRDVMKGNSVFRRPGSDLLFRVLRRSTIGAGAFNGRVRDGIGLGHPAIATRPAKDRRCTFHCRISSTDGYR